LTARATRLFAIGRQPPALQTVSEIACIHGKNDDPRVHVFAIWEIAKMCGLAIFRFVHLQVYESQAKLHRQVHGFRISCT
jgi:hypothetical protein